MIAPITWLTPEAKAAAEAPRIPIIAECVRLLDVGIAELSQPLPEHLSFAEFLRLRGETGDLSPETPSEAQFREESEPVKADLAAIPAANDRIIERVGNLTLKETANRIGITPEQTMEFVTDGKLKWINVGRGKIRPRYRFAEADIDDFIEQRTTREEPKSCLFTDRKSPRRTIGSTSSSTVVGFTARRSAHLERKPKNSKR
jgi:hypothetical protein